MAFTDSQKTHILYFLGWPLTGAGWLNPYIDQQLEEAGDGGARQTQIEEVLARLEEIDGETSKLQNALSNLEVSRVDVIELRDDEIIWLRSEGRRLAEKLSNMLNIEIYSDMFAGRTLTRRFLTAH